MVDSVGFEIDFLPVGSGDQSGDAIAIRYGSYGNYRILVYDGGTMESGQELVNHIKKYYQSSRVDYVVNSHPDADHASGLSVVLEQLEVGELWLHRPWAYSSLILGYFIDGRITDNSLAERLKEKMAAAYNLERLAVKNHIPVYEPFSGAAIGDFVVLSPERNWYVHELIAEFQKSPEQKNSTAQLLKAILQAATKATSWVGELWGVETLREDVETSAENESGVVLFGKISGRGVLLTGDAGIRALNATADVMEAYGTLLPNNLQFVQIPHHGSRHNVSTTVLDRIVGPRKIADDGASAKTAYVSAGKESATHPRKAVVNAFIRRGCQVVATQGEAKCHRHNMPTREGWVAVTPLPFSDKVEAWE
ncbi:MAG: ComEC/Rec2 family competence protein [Chloroflexota bacterium]